MANENAQEQKMTAKQIKLQQKQLKSRLEMMRFGELVHAAMEEVAKNPNIDATGIESVKFDFDAAAGRMSVQGMRKVLGSFGTSVDVSYVVSAMNESEQESSEPEAPAEPVATQPPAAG